MIHILCEEARKNSMYDHPEFVDPMWIIIGSFPEKCNFPWKRKFFSPPLLSVFWRGERLPTFRRWYGIRSLFFKIPSGPPCIAKKLLLKTKVKQKVFFLQKLSWTFGVAVEGPPIFMGCPRKKQGVDEIFAFARASKGGGSRWWWWRLRSVGLRTMSSRPVPPSKFVFRHQEPAKRAAKKGGRKRR